MVYAGGCHDAKLSVHGTDRKSPKPGSEVRNVLHSYRRAGHFAYGGGGAGLPRAYPVEEINMHGNKQRTPSAQTDPGLRLSNKLLSMAAESPSPVLDKSKSKDERQAEEESKADTVSKPGGFDNDPDDPTNPNEVRERHLKKIKR
jgi:hypothetical protein